jgi:hypothetical protein
MASVSNKDRMQHRRQDYDAMVYSIVPPKLGGSEVAVATPDPANITLPACSGIGFGGPRYHRRRRERG